MLWVIIIVRIRIQIKTPKGYAASTSNKVKPFIIGTKKINNHEVYANKKDDTIIWIIDCSPKDLIRIQRNVILFDKTTKTILQNKLVRKLSKLNTEQRSELDKMLNNQTEIKIIRSYDHMPNVDGWNKEI